MGTALIYTLRGDAIDIVPVAGPDGAVERMTIASGGVLREFAGDEIVNVASPEGMRATVLLETGAADGPIVRASVMLPVVDSPGDGPFDVTAGLLRTTSPSLFGGVRPGPQQSYEAQTLTGTVALAHSSPEYEPEVPAAGTCQDWSAVHDKQPPGPSRLVVTGTCTFPSAGFGVELRRTSPQGINPADLLLDKIVTPPVGPVAQVVTEVEVRYEEETEFEHTTVSIMPGGPTIDVVVAV